MTRTRVNEIDLLRFIAALAVVLYHYTFRGYAADALSVMPYPLLAPFSKYGYLGVQLFFMISGFVILMTASSGSLRGFVVSRLVRLYPAFWVCCTLTFAVTLAIGAPRYAATMSRYLCNMTMLSGFFGVTSIDGAYWTLFVEMKFYALVAVILAFRKIHHTQFYLCLWLIASVALEIQPFEKLRYLLIADYSAFFIAGATYFLIWSQGLSGAKIVLVILSWALAVWQNIKGLTGFGKHYNTVMNAHVVSGIITAFFLVMLLVSLRRTGAFGRKHWLLAGVLTYPLYLLHANIGFMLFNIAYPRVNPHVLLWSTIFIILGLAYAVHRFIEKKYSLLLKNSINKSLERIYRIYSG